MKICLRLVQFSLVAQSCPTLGDSMNHTTPGLPVHNRLPESTQTHVNTDYCGNLGLTYLHLCCTFTFLKPCVLLDYIILLLRHHSSLIELGNLSFIHGHLKSGLIFPFQPYFLLIKSRKPAWEISLLMESYIHPSDANTYPHSESCFSALAYSAPVLPPHQDLQSNPPVFFLPHLADPSCFQFIGLFM